MNFFLKGSFKTWLRGRKLTPYAKRIIQLHKKYPRLRLHALVSPKAYLASKSWKTLTSLQKVERVRSLSVLRQLRLKKSFTEACKEFGISKESVLKHVGKAIYRKAGRLVARKTDSIQRQMRIYEKGHIVSITVRNSRDASIIGEYYTAVKKFLHTREPKHLRKFKRITIKDAQGKKHKLETNPKKILEIEERKENPEGYEIYEIDGYG